jgi:hypothetical protein
MWIQNLFKDKDEENEHDLEYLTSILELIGLVAFNLGDMDMLPFSNEIMEIIRSTQSWISEFQLKKR